MYPKLQINLKKLEDNLNACAAITKERGGCSLMIVTKGLCADKEMVKMVAENPHVDFIADSRVKNIASFSQMARTNGKKTVYCVFRCTARFPRSSNMWTCPLIQSFQPLGC